jgi:hypothetical protein
MVVVTMDDTSSVPTCRRNLDPTPHTLTPLHTLHELARGDE